MNLDDIGRAPLPGPARDWQTAQFEPAFVQLKAEIDKLSSITAAGAVDWARVVDLAAEVLSTTAKDLTAAAYLGVGLTQTRGLEGLGTGARILRDMAATFWDSCTPPKNRLRGRMAAFSWWQEKCLAWLKNAQDLPPLPAQAHLTLMEAVRALDQTLSGLLPDLPPLRDLLEVLSRVPVQAEAAPAPQPPAGESGQTTPRQAAQPQNTAPANAEDARAVLAEAARTFAALAGRETPADPWAWRATRIAAWLRIGGLPPEENGRTLLPPPDPAVKAALLSLLDQGNFLLAAQTAEEQIPEHLFWLDPHRVAVQALEALGSDYAAAREAVLAELGLLLAHLPGLERLSFADGTPFADAETLDWLAGIQGAPPRPDAATRPARGEAAKARAEAEALFERQDVAGALDLLGQASRQADDGPTRLRLSLAQMSLLCRAGHWPLATSLAEEAVAEVERRGLEDWDPELAVETFLAAREAVLGQGGDDAPARAGAYASRAARIRPSAALHLSG
ncbi:type VI secretion system protein VasJ [Humidesulfovibrio mexicanus]|uniref:Type VI secretion system protein VasJ n=1 Tax=Humidesulfovibrio mexicanus TaxID=147047 RepID=A0A239A2C5_9BACT|nr:type VI secretion system protein TssA [Humidesulfovibrio mexicanus]SNR89816.1 type VI secretion system protein VasJ [Humidesulfovibrio mexicanus]